MNEITLNNLKIGSKAKVIKVNNTGSIRRRLMDIGIVPGNIITAYLSSPFKDPVAYKIKNALIAIRKNDSKEIIVKEII